MAQTTMPEATPVSSTTTPIAQSTMPEATPVAQAPMETKAVETAITATPEEKKFEITTQPTPPTEIQSVSTQPSIETAIPTASTIELMQIKGIKEKRATYLKTIGINSINDLSKASAQEIAKKLQISPKTVEKWITDAKKLAK
jgi:predicted flap endonuclease-1-like 5' DNA nuclease